MQASGAGLRQARNSKRRDWECGAAVIQAPPLSANVAVRASATARRGAAGRAQSCLPLKRKISRRACGSRAWRCHTGFGRAPFAGFRQNISVRRSCGSRPLSGCRSGRLRKRGRRTDNTGPCRVVGDVRPLVEMGPPVPEVMALRLLVLAAVRISGCAVCERRISASRRPGCSGLSAFWLHGSAMRAWVLWQCGDAQGCTGSAERSGDMAFS
jgi:hypothetical protein